MKISKSLLIVLILLSTTTLIASSKSQDQNYKDAIDELKVCSELLSQEKQRWETLHTNPITDIWAVEKEGDNMVIKVTIDDNIKNIINDQPISRSYTLTPTDPRLLPPFDIILGACFVIPDGFRPYLGIGYRPYNDIKKYTGYAFPKNIGISIGTTLTSVDIVGYYMTPYVLNSMVFIGTGISITGTTALLGVGLIF